MNKLQISGYYNNISSYNCTFPVQIVAPGLLIYIFLFSLLMKLSMTSDDNTYTFDIKPKFDTFIHHKLLKIGILFGNGSEQPGWTYIGLREIFECIMM